LLVLMALGCCLFLFCFFVGKKEQGKVAVEGL